MTYSNFNIPGSFSYEQYFNIVKEITKNEQMLKGSFYHMLFNLISRNQDDHTKNFGFLMDKKGNWRTSPIYDLTYSNGNGYTSQHQMTLNGKRDTFIIDDILLVNKLFDIERSEELLKKNAKHYTDFFKNYMDEEGKKLDVSKERIERIIKNCRVF